MGSAMERGLSRRGGSAEEDHSGYARQQFLQSLACEVSGEGRGEGRRGTPNKPAAVGNCQGPLNTSFYEEGAKKRG